MNEKELAKTIYENIFHIDGAHILKRGVDDTKKFILQTIQDSNINRNLFWLGLSNLFEEDKIKEIKSQKARYGRVIMQNYEKILELYEWIIEQQKSPVIGLSFGWLGTSEQLIKLYNNLSKKHMICSQEAFVDLFSDDITSMYGNIKWIETNISLVFFFEWLKISDLIADSHILGKIGLLNKSDKALNANDVDVARNTLNHTNNYSSRQPYKSIKEFIDALILP